jgi:hypothetical protein
MKIRHDPFYRQAVSHRTLGDAFRGVEYAQWFDRGEHTYSPTPLFVAALTVLSFCAMIIVWLIHS